jgi:hypothetical protein
MKSVTRRSVTTGMLAAVTAIPALGLAMSVRAHPGDDKLLEAIGRYRGEVTAINASSGLDDEEIDAWMDRADAFLIEAVAMPVSTTAGAMAVISLFIDEGWMLSQHNVFGDEFLALARAALNYVASALQAA